MRRISHATYNSSIDAGIEHSTTSALAASPGTSNDHGVPLPPLPIGVPVLPMQRQTCSASGIPYEPTLCQQTCLREDAAEDVQRNLTPDCQNHPPPRNHPHPHHRTPCRIQCCLSHKEVEVGRKAQRQS